MDEQSPRHGASNIMPPKKITRKVRVNKTKKQNNNSNKSVSAQEIAKLTQMVRQLNKPKNQVTDLGRMLLNGGNYLGSFVGMPRIFGEGSYSFEQNSLWNASQQVPAVHSSNESVLFRHREYIADISVNGANFTTATYNINPGLPTTFPFLSSIAGCFQEYSFKGLIFEYKTTSATAIVSGTNSAMGSVMLAIQYRSDALAFTSKTQMLNEMWSVDTVPSADCILPVECSPKENPFSIQYVRGTAATGDIKMFDLGLLTVATAGAQAGQTNVVGELWVSYEIEFRKPQLLLPGTEPVSDITYAYCSTTTPTSAAPFTGMTALFEQGVTITFPTTSSVTFTGLVVGNNYIIFFYWAALNTAAGVFPTLTTVGGSTNLTYYDTSADTVHSVMGCTNLSVTATTVTISLSGQTLPVTGSPVGVLRLSSTGSING